MTQGLSERVRRVFRMDAEVYGEAAADPALTGQALAVVLGAAFAEGLGRWLAGDLAAGLTGVIDGGLRWMVWLVAIHAAARALGSESDLAALSRGLGFASAPFALGLFEQMPGLGGLFWLAKWGLGFAAFALATRRVLGVELPTAGIACAIGLAAVLIVARPVAWLVAA